MTELIAAVRKVVITWKQVDTFNTDVLDELAAELDCYDRKQKKVRRDARTKEGELKKDVQTECRKRVVRIVEDWVRSEKSTDQLIFRLKTSSFEKEED